MTVRSFGAPRFGGDLGFAGEMLQKAPAEFLDTFVTDGTVDTAVGSKEAGYGHRRQIHQRGIPNSDYTNLLVDNPQGVW